MEIFGRIRSLNGVCMHFIDWLILEPDVCYVLSHVIGCVLEISKILLNM